MVLLLYLVLGVVIAHAQEPPVVNTTQGSIQGTKATDGDYFVFYGIHYAGPVSGVNRFKVAPPPPIYPEVFHAINDDVICAQPTSRGIVGVEDCLTLNIYTPNITTSQPVLVWIVGEEYTTSDPTPRSFKNFIDQNIVVVKINYRLSIFGFLCLRVEQAPGNAGLKDIVLGLKWIKQNIANFGGDPDNVILFGHGSGGAMVDLITMSPSSRNLAHKVIVHSGSALSPTAVAYDPIGYAQMFGRKLGYFYQSREKLADALIKTDIDLFASKLIDFELLNNTVLFAPCIENDAHDNNTILTEAPINILKSGNYNQIPYIAGFTDKEGTIRTAQAVNNQWLNKMDESFEDFLQVDLEIKPQANKTVVVDSIRQFYFSKNSINMKFIENYTDYHGDTMISVSVIRGVRERAKTSKAEVNLYHFKFKGTYNSEWAFPQIPLTGVRHGGVLNYLLNYDLQPSDVDVMKSLMQRYTMFIWNGTTNSPKIVEWRPVSSILFYLCYGGEVSPNFTISYESGLINPMEATIAFWDDLYSKYYKAPPQPSSATKLSILTIFLAFCKLITMFV